MLFDRFRRSSSSRAPRFAFYGKLPFDREFLRHHLDSAEGRWIISWVHGAHELMAARREAGESHTDTAVRAAIACDGGRAALAAVIRPSRDGGGRSYPTCAFCVVPTADVRDAWHLTPLWLEPVWQLMEDDILGGTAANRKELDDILDRRAPEPADPEAIAARFERASTMRVDQPWQVLTAAADAQVHSWAVTFVQLARVQRAAPDGRAGIAVRLPLNPAAEPAPMVRAAAWLRLFSAVASFRSPWPAVIAVQPTEAAAGSVCVFGREPTADDLAHLLSGSGSAPIDELADAWETPEAAEDQRHLEALVDDTSTCLADLWRSMS